MTEEARKVLEQALRLPPEARAAVAADLLASLDQGDQLDPAQLARLNAAIDAARLELARGEGIPAEHVLAELRAKRSP